MLTTVADISMPDREQPGGDGFADGWDFDFENSWIDLNSRRSGRAGLIQSQDRRDNSFSGESPGPRRQAGNSHD
jgi:hypothetical protein